MTEFVANFPTTWDDDELLDYPYRKFPCLVWKDNVCYLITSADVWNMNSLQPVYMCIQWPDLWIFRNETAPNHDDVNIDIRQCDRKLDQERNTQDGESLLRNSVRLYVKQTWNCRYNIFTLWWLTTRVRHVWWYMSVGPGGGGGRGGGGGGGGG
jgi:hypothetical protein